MTTPHTDQEFVFIVETFEPNDTAKNGPGQELRMQAEAARIQNDQKLKTGKYRKNSVFRCSKCSSAPGIEAPALLTEYIGPGGDQYVMFPKRLSSGGTDDTKRKVPTKARRIWDLVTGVEFAQCKRCLTHFTVMGLLTPPNKVSLVVTDVVESTFGAVNGTAQPSVVHKIRNDRYIRQYIEARRQADQAATT